MSTFFLVAQIALLVLGVVLTVAVLLQQGKSEGLSGSIAGGTETFFGKEKGNKLDKVLSRVTTVIGIAFVLVSLLVFIMQPGDYAPSSKNQGFFSMMDNVPTTDTQTDNAQ